MTTRSRDVTTAELAILEKLWENEFVTLKQLAKWLYGGETASNISTVQKLVSRLESKGFVERDRNHWPHRFRALVDRDRLITLRLQATADDLCEGSMSTLLMNVFKSATFSPRQRKHLRKLLDELEGGHS